MACGHPEQHSGGGGEELLPWAEGREIRVLQDNRGEARKKKREL